MAYLICFIKHHTAPFNALIFIFRGSYFVWSANIKSMMQRCEILNEEYNSSAILKLLLGKENVVCGITYGRKNVDATMKGMMRVRMRN